MPAQGCKFMQCQFLQWAPRLPKLKATCPVAEDMQLNPGDLCDLKALQALEVAPNVWIEAEGECISACMEGERFRCKFGGMCEVDPCHHDLQPIKGPF